MYYVVNSGKNLNLIYNYQQEYSQDFPDGRLPLGRAVYKQKFLPKYPNWFWSDYALVSILPITFEGIQHETLIRNVQSKGNVWIACKFMSFMFFLNRKSTFMSGWLSNVWDLSILICLYNITWITSSGGMLALSCRYARQVSQVCLCHCPTGLIIALSCRNVSLVLQECQPCPAGMPTLTCRNANLVLQECQPCPAGMPALSGRNDNLVLQECQPCPAGMPTLTCRNANLVLQECQPCPAGMPALSCRNTALYSAGPTAPLFCMSDFIIQNCILCVLNAIG